MKPYERLLRYVAVDTQSAEDSATTPSTEKQFDLARLLTEELKTVGCVNVRSDEHGYVYAEIPATAGLEKRPKLGFIAHMDTSPDFPGKGVKPQIIPNYDGKDVALGTSGRVLSTAMFPHLKEWVGRTLITTDGTTLLGADDKAGVAEIVTLAERLITSGAPHGPIRIGFTPDEEIGRGADLFDISGFDADFAYTVDGDLEGSLSYENFNACAAHFEVQGVNVHPGEAKDRMVNALLVAMEVNTCLPQNETPAATDGRNGFYHATDLTGDVSHATLDYIIRDFDEASFNARQKTMKNIEQKLNEKYGAGTVTLTLTEQYRNMIEKIRPVMHLVDRAVEAAKKCGAVPTLDPIRGGTDGARLSFDGLPCPNLGTGGCAFHGPFEHISVEGMDTATDILCEIVRLYAE